MEGQFLWRFIALRIGFISAAVLALLFGYACLQLAKMPTPQSSVNDVNLYWNPFYSHSQASINNIEGSIAGARRQLEFMTFARERQQDARAVVAALRNKISHRPFSSHLWAELVAFEAQAKLAESARLNSMAVALKLSGWNHESRLSLTAYCLENPPVLLQAGSVLCQSLLKNMPYDSIQANASKMGVGSAYLAARLAEVKSFYMSGDFVDPGNEAAND